METTRTNNCLCVYGKQLITSKSNFSEQYQSRSSGNGENHQQEANASCLAILGTRSQEMYDGKKGGFFFRARSESVNPRFHGNNLLRQTVNNDRQIHLRN